MLEELRQHDKYISDAEDEARTYDIRFAEAERVAKAAAQAAREAQTELQAAQDSRVEVKAGFDKVKQNTHDSQVGRSIYHDVVLR